MKSCGRTLADGMDVTELACGLCGRSPKLKSQTTCRFADSGITEQSQIVYVVCPDEDVLMLSPAPVRQLVSPKLLSVR